MISEDEPWEPDPFNALHELSRIEELRRRNTLCLPHLRSVYPLESFDVSAGKSSVTRTADGHADNGGGAKRTSVEARLSNASLEDTLAAKRKVMIKVNLIVLRI